MTGDAITAGAMALAARYDPQFVVPHRPRMRRGVVLRRHGDQLLVDGTPTRHVLRGTGATDLVPRLLPLLDGRLDHAGLAQAAGAELADVFAAVSLLWTCGVVEEAAPSHVDTHGVSEQLADHLSRVGDSTAAHPAWESAAAELRAARLEVFGPPLLVEAVLGELVDTIPAIAGHGATPAPGTTLVVLSTIDGIGSAAHDDLVRRCWTAGRPLLRIDLTAATVEVGPYVDRRLGPCLFCQLATDSAGAPIPTTVDSVAEAPEAGGAVPASRADDVALAGAMAAADLVALIGRASSVPLPSRWRRVNLARMSTSVRSGATRPGCPLCSVVTPISGGEPRPTGIAARYEAAVALPPRRFADLKAHQMHYKPANVALQRGHRTWPAAPRTGLPEPKWERLAGSPNTAPTTIDLDTLSLLLMVAAGWRDDQPDRVQRWTASGGNIGSPIAYLVARHVDGLAPGGYGYLAPTHELALLRGREDRTGPAAGLDGLCGSAPATLVLTADLARVAHKYGAFGLRVVLLDGGCALATVLAAADRSGLSGRPEPDWDDTGIAALLGLDPMTEPITGVLRLSPADHSSTVDSRGGTS
jgi:SagB-type dehydrogenase family enzyme